MTGRQWLGITTPNWCIWSDAPRSRLRRVGRAFIDCQRAQDAQADPWNPTEDRSRLLSNLVW